MDPHVRRALKEKIATLDTKISEEQAQVEHLERLSSQRYATLYVLNEERAALAKHLGVVD